jgi:hypothetical protein
MSFEDFLSGLDSVADLYYNEDYDEKNPSMNASNRPVEEKRIFLYQFLQCGNRKHFMAVRKPFGHAFSSTNNVGARIPEDDPSKRYSYRITETKKQAV